MEQFRITVNGQVRTASPAGVHTNLLDYLRDLGLTGAKEGCAEGECGACAVMVARVDGATPGGVGSPAVAGAEPRAGTPDRSRWAAINACLLPALAFDGQEVITAEGLGSAESPGREAELHPVQREMVERGGSQCGYCTPGFICSMAAEYYRPGRTSGPVSAGATASGEGGEGGAGAAGGENGFDLHALSGNLCRCTGYRPIRDAALALGAPPAQDALARRQGEPAPPVHRTHVHHHGARFIRPASLAEFLDLYAAEPGAAILAGATDLGVDINLQHSRPALVLAVDHLPELRAFDISGDHIEVGAALTLSELERALAGQVPLLAELFPQFASPLIRNTATLGGNIATASPIGDAAPVLLALDASLVLASTGGQRTVALADYFTGYRETVREGGEVIRAIRIPRPLAPLSAFYKMAKRRFDDISSVAVAIAVTLGDRPGDDGAPARGMLTRGMADDDGSPEGEYVTAVRIGLGGVAATPIRARRTEQSLIGKRWSAQTLREAAALMAREGTPLDDHRASAAYRAAMLEQSMLRFFAEHDPSQPVEVAR